MNQNRLADKTKIKAHYHEPESLKRHSLEAYEARFSENRNLTGVERYRWDCICEVDHKTLAAARSGGCGSTWRGCTSPRKRMVARLGICGTADPSDFDLLHLIGTSHQRALNS